MVEHVSRTGEQQPKRIGQEGRRRGAVAAQVHLDRLDRICTLATGTIEVFIDYLGGGRLQRGDDKARMISRAHAFRLEHHAPRACPGACGIAELVLEPGTVRWRLAMGTDHGDPLVMEMTRGLEGGSALAEPDGVPREPKDTIGPAVGGDHVDDLGGGKMSIAADQTMRVGPVAPELGQQPDQNHGIFGPRRADAWT